MKSVDFIIKESKDIPFSSKKQSLIEGSRNRNMTALKYSLIRFRNYCILLLAYIAPSNKLRIGLNRLKGVHIAENVYIGMFVFIDNAYPEYIYIEEDAAVNAGSMLVAHFNPKEHFQGSLFAKVAPILIKRGAIVAIRSIINPGVTIGECAVVAAGSVVYDDVEARILVRGNPAKKVCRIRMSR